MRPRSGPVFATLALLLVVSGPRGVAGQSLDPKDVAVFADFKVSMGALETLSGEARMSVPVVESVTARSRLAFAFAKPFRFSIVNETEKTRILYGGGQAWIVFEDRDQAVNLNLGAGSEDVTGFFDMFRFSSFVEGVLFADIQAHFIVEVTRLDPDEPGPADLASDEVATGAPPTHRLRFDCRDDSVYRWGLGIHHVDIWICAPESRPTALEIFNADSDGSTLACRIDIDRLDTNVDLPAATFRYDPPPGMDVMGAFDALTLFVKDALGRSVKKAVGLYDSWKGEFKSYLETPWGGPPEVAPPSAPEGGRPGPDGPAHRDEGGSP